VTDMKIVIASGDYVFEGDVIEPSEFVCRNCGAPLLEIFPTVAAILVGTVGSYPYILHECETCECYYWKGGINERENS
jgi:uncharacterized protein with PIN domain